MNPSGKSDENSNEGNDGDADAKIDDSKLINDGPITMTPTLEVIFYFILNFNKPLLT